MPRKRMIDPSIWTDEGMAEISPRQQLLYIGLFSNADDDGRLKGSPVAISLMLPTLYAGVSKDEIEADVSSVCASMRQLARYDVDDRPYLEFKNFRQWQRIDRPTPSILPAPLEASSHIVEPVPEVVEQSAVIDEDSTSNQRVLDPSLGEEKVGEEKVGEKGESNSPPQPIRPPKSPSGPAQQIVAAYCAEIGIEKPAAYSKAVGVAQHLHNAGIAASDVPDLFSWLMADPIWANKGVDLGTMLANADKWRAANAPKKPKDPNRLESGLARAG